MARGARRELPPCGGVFQPRGQGIQRWPPINGHPVRHVQQEVVMAKNDYIPSTDADFVLWHDHLKGQSAEVGASLGITAEDLTALNRENDDLHEVMENNSTAQA